MTRAELKNNARQELRGNWGWAILVSLTITVIYWLLFAHGANSSLQLANDLNSAVDSNQGIIFNPTFWAGRVLGGTGLDLLGGFFMLSMVITFLALARGHRFSFFNSIFSVFTNNRFVPELLNYILSYIFQILWTCLLIIPGIVKSYSYALTPYIVSDLVDSGQEVHATTGINESRRLMNGHKWELFVLDLSFIGWYFVVILTLGIANLWVLPYVQTTKANFYRNLAGDQFRQ